MNRFVLLAVVVVCVPFVGGSFAVDVGGEFKLLPSDGGGGSSFGSWVVGEGNEIFVGARLQDGGSGNRGAVYVYNGSGASWIESQKLKGSTANNASEFGVSLDVEGGVLVVGDFQPQIGETGQAFVFEKSGGSWVEQQRLIGSDTVDEDRFGHVVSVSGGSIFVGATRHNAVGSNSGAVYVFDAGGGSWVESQKLVASDGAANDQFGRFVRVVGDTVYVASLSAGSGALYVFERSGGSFAQVQKIIPSDASSGAFFGSFAVEGDGRLFVGAPGVNAVYVFERSGGLWNEVQKLTPTSAGSGGDFGASLGYESGFLVVAASMDDGAGSNAGAVFGFALVDGSWVQVAQIRASDASSGARFGTRTTVHNSIIFVGAFGVNTVYGYIFNPIIEPPPQSALFGPEGLLYGGNKTQYADLLLISEEALDAFMGVFWVLLFTAALFLMLGRQVWAGFAGAGVGLMWNLAWGLWPLWVLFFVLGLGAALYVVRGRRNG